MEPFSRRYKMTRILLFGALLTLGACQSVATPPEPAEISNIITATADVVWVEADQRLVTLRSEDGGLFEFYAGEDVRNFDQIAVGDTLRVSYEERLMASLRPAEEQGAAVEGAFAAARAEEGDKPGAGIGMSVSVRVKIESIDLENDIVVFSLGSGELVAHRIATPEGQAFVKGVRLGDIVRLDYTQAIALTVEEL